MHSVHIKRVVAKKGIYEGIYDQKTEVCSFLGIPFANAKRWEEPTEVKTNSEDLVKAYNYGPSPWQNVSSQDKAVAIELNEECLNLNIYYNNASKRKRAVMVWIYGGSQIAGNNIGGRTKDGEALYDGRRMVENNPDIMLVVPNYRTGIWGSANLSMLKGYSNKYSASNNLARLDIIQCLKWIHQNIWAFGGDANNITLFGQSAGSANITSLMLMPKAKGLFRRVICESSFAMDLSLTTYRDSVTISDDYFKRLKVSSIEEALMLEPEELLKVQNEIVIDSMTQNKEFPNISSKLFSPVVDNISIHDSYWEYFMNIGCRDVDYMGGTNEGEYDWQFNRYKGAENWIDAKGIVMRYCENKLGDSIGDIINQYIEDNYKRTEFEAYKDLKNDLYLRIGAVCYAIVMAERGASSYLYYMVMNGANQENSIRCPHGAEVPILFMNDQKTDKEMQEKIRKCWFNFARYGNPNTRLMSYEETWMRVSCNTLNTMIIGKDLLMTHGVRIRDLSRLIDFTNEYNRFSEFRKLCDSYVNSELEECDTNLA